MKTKVLSVASAALLLIPTAALGEPAPRGGGGRVAHPHVVQTLHVRAEAHVQVVRTRPLDGLIWVYPYVDGKVLHLTGDNGCREMFYDRDVIVRVHSLRCGMRAPAPMEFRYVSTGRPRRVKIMMRRGPIAG